jgi:lipoprotein-anchoring transpeptidase ErfK/SrfK
MPRPQVPPIPRPPVAQPRAAARPKKTIFTSKNLVIVGLIGSVALVGVCMLVMIAGFALMYGSGNILPSVQAAGVDVSGMDESQAAAELDQAWNSQGLLLRDEDRTWAASPADIGISLDSAATAARAYAWGRSDGGIGGALRSLFGDVEIDPVLSVDISRMHDYLQSVKSSVDQPAVNAGVRLVNGQAVAAPAVAGRELDIPATITLIQIDGESELADGALDLVMIETSPAITDATPLVAQANALLTSPFTVNGYDPIRDEWTPWTAAPDVWATWLTAAESTSGGLSLGINPAAAGQFLQANANFGDERYIDFEHAAASMQAALAQGQTSATVRIWHNPTTYTVGAGQTIASIAEEVGIPYPYILAENPDMNSDALSVGQEIRLPSRDILVPLEPIPQKRIVVDRGDQHLWAYENGEVVFDWVISTGLSTSPTALGIFQVQSHDVNAYADQWNLYMPNFMGFYHPGPNMDLWNGFHGFPTRGGGYLLWSDDLGHPVTYGCVLLSLENAETLYNWAEEGVVVEVRS